MRTRHVTRAAKVLRVYCPIDSDTLNLLMIGQVSSIDKDGTLATILSIVREDNPLGDFGKYKSVVELAPGWELFTPDAAARPTLGQPGTAAVSPTAILTIYIPEDGSVDAVSCAIDAIVEAHPWEVPVIEITETLLVTRA